MPPIVLRSKLGLKNLKLKQSQTLKKTFTKRKKKIRKDTTLSASFKYKTNQHCHSDWGGIKVNHTLTFKFKKRKQVYLPFSRNVTVSLKFPGNK